MDRTALRGRAEALGRLLLLEGRRALSGVYLGALAGFAAWIGLVVLWSHVNREEGAIENVQNGVIAPLLLILAVYQGSRLVLGEQEDRTAEVLFSLPGSRGRIWLGKLLVLYLAILVGAIEIAALSYLFVADFPLVRTVLHSMVPAIFFANLALLLSLLLRTWPAAALLGFLIAIGFALLSGASYTEPLAYLYPFLNPSAHPPGASPYDWFRMVVLNRIAVLSLSAIWLVLSGVLIRRPERVL